MPPSKAEKARMNTHLRKHGLGGLEDPTLLEQLAFFVKTHAKFQEMLMRVEPAERANSYKAIAPRLSFKAKPLEDYVIAAKREAENLPVYDHKTLAVTMPNAPVMSGEMKEAITGKTLEARTLEERREAERLEKAEGAIAEDLGQTQARGRLEIMCRKCQFGTTVYALNRGDAFETLIANGWKISGDNAYCPDCEPTPEDQH